MTGGLKSKNGRETGERTNIPPVPWGLCLSVFEVCDGTKGGTFWWSLSKWAFSLLLYKNIAQNLAVSKIISIFAADSGSPQGWAGHYFCGKRTFTNVIFSIWISQIQALEDTQPKRPHRVYCTLPWWASSIYLGVGYRVAYPSARQCESPDAG